MRSLHRAFSRKSACTLITVLSISFLAAPHVEAQNGRLIEDLFRTFAESKLEKERQRRAQAQNRPPVLLPPGQTTLTPSKDPYRVKLPSGFGSPTARPPVRVPGGSATIAPRPSSPVTTSVNVRSAAARDYVQQLVGFNGAIQPLVNDLRRGVSKHPELRPLLPQVYQIAADGRSLINRCNGISSLNPILQPYQDLDARWRQVSFALKSIDGLSPACTTAIQQCDQFCGSMCKQLQLQPQFDRRALHDEMIIASTHLQTLMDDMELANISQAQCHRLTHDCRLLRQRLLSAAQRVNEYSYDEIAQSFTRFVQDWGAFAQSVYALRSPHLDRRLARVSECGDRTYAILWMAPPAAMHDVAGITARLAANFESLSNRITFRSISTFPNKDQVRLLGAMPSLNQKAGILLDAAKRNSDQRELARLFGDLDRTWVSVQPDFLRIPGISRGTITDIERGCDELRHVFGAGAGTSTITATQMIQNAAALEGSSEFIYKELQRVGRQLKSGSYRNSITNGAREFYTHSRELHEEISKPGRLNDSRYLDRLQRETQRMVEGWNQLSKEMFQLEQQGLSRTDSQRIRRAYRDVQPYVAQVAAALLGD